MKYQRNAGVLLPVSSLPGPFGVGTLGKEAYHFVDVLREAGFSLWQVLPLSVTDEFHSPYKSRGAFSLDPVYIDLDELAKEGLLTAAEVEKEKVAAPYRCDFPAATKTREKTLALAYRRYLEKDEGELEAFLSAHPDTRLFCRFEALVRANGTEDIHAFQTEEIDEDTARFMAFLQMKVYNQWQKLRKYAHEKGVLLVGDMPIYVAENSADVYFSPEEFQLDGDRLPTKVAGVPPDYFSADGQLWGNPLYDFARQKQNSFGFFRRRAAFMAELFDVVRIDHFRAFESYFAIPAGKTPREGKFNRAPGMALVRAIREAAPDTLFVAEDLGDITDRVRKLVADSGFPCMRVFQFGFLGDEKSLHRPHAVPENAFYYSGTHDNNTLLGFVFEADDGRRRDLFRYCGYTGAEWNLPEAYDAIYRALFSSHARTVVLPLQDLLLFGADTRVNTPGRAENNWTYRVTREQIDAVNREKFRALLSLYDRA